MKFVVSSTALLNVLQTSNKVVSNKNTLPILDNFLFELKDGVLKITASDLETTMIGTLKVDSMEQEGVIARPARRQICILHPDILLRWQEGEMEDQAQSVG